MHKSKVKKKIRPGVGGKCFLYINNRHYSSGLDVRD